MIMNILIILLVLAVVLFILTLVRDKKHKMAARGNFGGKRDGRKIFSTLNQSRSQGTVRQQEPTLTSAAETVNEIEIKASHQQPLEEIYSENDKLAEEDADAILGLKPKIASNHLREVTRRVESKEAQNPAPCVNFVEENVSGLNKMRSCTKKRIIIYLKATKQNPYNGYELLQTLLANHFRFGDMNIFHRHERTNGDGQRLFSVAAATPTGTFDLTNMGGFSCYGLSLFFSLHEVPNPLVALNIMLETASQLIEELGGSVLDDQQQPLTAAVIQLWREEVRNYIHINDFSEVR